MARRYSEDEKATALVFVTSMGGNINKAAKKLNIPVMTLWKWVKGKGINADVTEKAKHKKEDLADLWEAEVRAALDEAKLVRDAAGYSGLILAAAQGTDKMRLLRDEPTAINKNEHIHAGEDAILAAAEEVRFRRLIGDAGEGITSGVHEGDVPSV